MNNNEASRAEQCLGLVFFNKNLLKVALTHKSFTAETNDEVEVNERLEFLGDAVLELVITDFLYNHYPNLEEGNLAMLRANIVNAEVLAKLAKNIGLGKYIFMSKGTELTGGRRQVSILGDCLEAVLGAVYLDQGIEKTKEFILTIFQEEIKRQASKEKYLDLKTNLQEYTMKKFQILPLYKITREEGSVHDRTFFAEVGVGDHVWGKGKGKSKKKAEQEAAKEALQKLQKLHG
ncbi:ribonuclease III [Candidatus Oleimmundimicrobium sp.]|uniref:ribonuclease III n=1 Tax=Candidatus Oleimmundimicrobium sp. TaxID=3060597 RepID=UPI00271C3C8A|nr:ribonuclease III [Candidatus Oleimmundimicrobium sp.]MDO8885358.1 ribonuclease III [Candidatus Oleimmundimicrobium sp.]